MAKRDLYLGKPLLNAAGFLGYYPNGNNANAIKRLEGWGGLAALVTDPISYLPRRAPEQAALIDTEGGSLLHNGAPNAGFWQTLKVASRKWDASPLPIIVHLMGEDVERARKMVAALERMENVLAVELGLPLYRPEMLNAWLEAMPALSVEMPVIANLPMQLAAMYGERFARKGASAISLRPPRGRVKMAEVASAEQTILPTETMPVAGRLYGPQVYPLAAEVVYQLAKAGLPLIAGGGYDNADKIGGAMELGALAVQVDLPCWW